MKQDLRQALTKLSEASYSAGHRSACLRAGISVWDEEATKVAQLLNDLEDAVAQVRRAWPKPGEDK